MICFNEYILTFVGTCSDAALLLLLHSPQLVSLEGGRRSEHKKSPPS